MESDDRKHAIRKFHSACVSEIKIPTRQNESPGVGHSAAASSIPPSQQGSFLDVSVGAATTAEKVLHSLSVPVEDACYLPKQCIEGIWEKASRLVALRYFAENSLRHDHDTLRLVRNAR